MQEDLGTAIIKVAQEVLAKNLSIEGALSPVGEDGRHGLAVASDTRWDKRGTTRQCGSLSGCAVAFGLQTAVPLGVEAMASMCMKCTKNIDHEPDACSNNCTGSSKGMEAAGAAKTANILHGDAINKCCAGRLITDNDLSVRKILTHLHKEQLETLEIPWPRHQGKNGKMGKKKPDNGHLPLLHAMTELLADKGHRVHGHARFLFLEAAKSIANGCGLTKMDAERMKRQFNSTQRLHSYTTCHEGF
jgi:hypothetical protein